MITPATHDLRNAEAALAVANTPLFLIRKLSDDPNVRAISHSLSGEQILDTLRASVEGRPQTLFQAVVPFVCLVALSLLEDDSYLQASKGIQPSYEDDWFAYAREVLVQTFKPTSRRLISAMGPTVPQTVTTKTGAPTKVVVLARTN
jgi:hypothetical protein